jgi:hypothetical protein
MSAGNQPYPSSHQYSSHQQQPFQQHPFPTQAVQTSELDWIRNTDYNLLSDGHVNGSSNAMGTIPQSQFPDDPGMLPDLGDIEGWWSPPHGTSGMGGTSM